MTSPSMPAISATLCTRRMPSRMRSICTIRLTALAICMRIALSGRLRLAIITMFSTR